MQEHAGDVYGLEVIHGLVPDSQEVAAHGFQVMGDLDLSDPNPPAFITFWLYSHPPLAERLVFAHSYDPWSKEIISSATKFSVSASKYQQAVRLVCMNYFFLIARPRAGAYRN